MSPKTHHTQGNHLWLARSRPIPKELLDHLVAHVQLMAQLLDQLFIGPHRGQLRAKRRHLSLHMLEAMHLLIQELDLGGCCSKLDLERLIAARQLAT